ncbi:MAG: arylsulfatase [Halobacteriaceae archaeon]
MSASDSTPAERPNVVLVMVDDMGYSDIAPYGGEIETPTLQRLADDGLRFTQFYNYARCCPTRASLVTGLHPHQTGIGHMTDPPDDPGAMDRGVPGYVGHLNDRCATVAERLSAAGYETLMAGKWHLGSRDAADRPTSRGFDRYYGHLAGAANYFDPQGPRGLSADGGPPGSVAPESTTDRRYYTTDAFTDHAIDFVRERDDDPFFLYLSYNAPHWPLQAHEDVVANYRGEYADGWDAVRTARYERQVEMGLFDPDRVPLTPADSPDWDSLSAETRDEMDRRMAIYAAQVDLVDRNLARLVAALEARGEFENTLFLFLSDNGACAEGGTLGWGDREDLNDPAAGLWMSYGRAWANASNTPFREYKHWVHEGGAATPLIVHWPAGLDETDAWRRQPAYLPDVVPTLLDVAGADYPETRDGIGLPALEGESLLPAFDGEALDRDRPMCMEHEGNRFVRDGRWKLVSMGDTADYGGDQTWELYDMATDRSETTDLAGEHPDRVDDLRERWWSWAERVGVVPNGQGTARRDELADAGE